MLPIASIARDTPGRQINPSGAKNCSHHDGHTRYDCNALAAAIPQVWSRDAAAAEASASTVREQADAGTKGQDVGG